MAGGNETAIACVIVTYNRDDFIGKCIDSLYVEQSADLAVEVIVIDNGSSDDTATVIEQYPSVEYIKYPKNIPLPKALNDGLSRALNLNVDHIILLNDDTEFKEQALKRMIDVCDEVDKCIVSPLQINYREPDKLDASMLNLMRRIDRLIEDAFYRRKIERYYDLPTIIGSAMLAKKETYRFLGGFDENFSFYGIDDDLCKRALKHNHRLLLVSDAHMYHMHGKIAVTTKTKVDWLKRWRSMYRARLLFILKNPERKFTKNIVAMTKYAFSSLMECISKGFLKGAFICIEEYFSLIRSRADVRRRRATDYKL